MKLLDIDINKVIRRSEKGYTLNFSDGRKEKFPSRDAAENRERQIQYFKHRNKMLKGGPGSGRHKEPGSGQKPNKDTKQIGRRATDRTNIRKPIRPSNTSQFNRRPGIGRKLGHLLTSTTGGAFQGGILGSLAGPVGRVAGAGAGAVLGGLRGLRNILRNRIPNVSTGREIAEQALDVGSTALITRFPYKRVGRFLGRGLRRR